MTGTIAVRSAGKALVLCGVMVLFAACGDRKQPAPSQPDTAPLPQTTQTAPAPPQPSVPPPPPSGPPGADQMTEDQFSDAFDAGVPLSSPLDSDTGAVLLPGGVVVPMPAPPGATASPPPPPRTPPVPTPMRPIIMGSGNLLENGSFDMPVARDGKIPYWQIPTGIKAVLDDKASLVDGTRSLRVTVAGNVDLGIAHPAKITPGKRYVVRGFIKTQDVEGVAELEVQKPGVSPPVTLSGSAKVVSVTGTADWTPVATIFTADWDLQEVNVLLRRRAAPDSPKTEGVIWFDRCEVIEIGRMTGVNLIEDVTLASRVKSCWLYMPQGVTALRDDQNVPPFTGTNASLQLVFSADPSVNLGVMQSVAVTPGKTYVLCGYIRTENIEGNASLEVQDDVRGHAAFFQRSNEVTGTSDWTLAVVKFTVPPGMTGCGVFLRRPAPDSSSSKPSAIPPKIWFGACGLFEHVG